MQLILKRSVVAVAATLVVPAVLAQQAPAPQPPETHPRDPGNRRRIVRRTWIITAVVMVLLALGVAVVSVSARRSRRRA